MNKEELILQKQENERYAKWSNYVYSSKRRIQRRVLAIERDIAHTILQFKTYKQREDLESFIAFLSCWKFSKIDFSQNTFWCDAIYFDEFTMKDDRTFIFSVQAWIGFTENTERQSQVPCSGYFTMNGHQTKLKSYGVYFYHETKKLQLIKST
ncbi:hypothetical protein GCM10025882_16460 [Acinetobacter gyllenbergii]|uniref:Uncharacterized protein n=1 Tax=Acinetobacter gyllenbergii CIP 110306 = MTCC 11365 TaxID=1217657 RepID=A0A829HG94_9GAMM|nr:hypothetical protein [Acinetobacter gyllenbergii]EPF77481.1 hypothetical protein F957_02653 [Acinetobacter gyllenbergii CIP 110306 = MTCC 11365]ESK41523.1 hypothetical protein F987_02262 [Acinetobacter gyllenbergii NIPH 230]GMA11221.1 hypothetical protein GCM10025882_16460 [Acinetobacter gyllenbergii]